MFYTTYVTMLSLRILFLIISSSCVLTQGATDESEIMDVFRLPNNTEPISYNLRIRPTIDPENNNFSFTGEVTIHIRVNTSTENITLNAYELNIENVEVKDADSSTKITVKDLKLVAKNEQLIIILDEPGLTADREYKVKIVYSGEIRNDMTGFYKSSYKDDESKSTK